MAERGDAHDHYHPISGRPSDLHNLSTTQHGGLADAVHRRAQARAANQTIDGFWNRRADTDRLSAAEAPRGAFARVLPIERLRGHSLLVRGERLTIQDMVPPLQPQLMQVLQVPIRRKLDQGPRPNASNFQL